MSSLADSSSANLLIEAVDDRHTGRSQVPQEILRRTEVLSRELSSPTTAEHFLKQNGFLTPSGKLPKKFGG